MFNRLKLTMLSAALMLLSVAVQAQEVKGVVKDATGNPLPGASVIVEGTAYGTVTDGDGNYKLQLKGYTDPVLQFSMIGMKNIDEKVDGRKTINVTMQEDTRYLDEVVVVGYQEVKRRDLLGAVTSVSSDKLVEQPVTTVSQALAGRMAGVSVVTTEGSPDPEMKVRIRGTGSITQSSEPLYIVDGFPADGIGDISPSQI